MKNYDWNAYSKSFQSVMPSEMLQLNMEAVQWMRGGMVDFGCGAGKIIPFALAQAAVRSYVGIDRSSTMVRRARWIGQQFPGKVCIAIEDDIESIQLSPRDSGLSINSYYAWSNPQAVLSHIYSQLKDGAIFVLATINPALEMDRLLGAAKMELVAHPHWKEFKRHNLAIGADEGANLVELDDLVEQTKSTGFRLKEAHTKLYGGGLNFLALEKP